MFMRFLFPRFLRLHMSDESVSVTVEVPETSEVVAEKTETETVNDQAAKIVELASEIAEKIATPEEEMLRILDALVSRLSAIENEMLSMRAESREAHQDIISRLESTKEEVEEIEEEIEQVAAPSIQTEESTPLPPPQEVPQEEAPPQKRQRKWL